MSIAEKYARATRSSHLELKSTDLDPGDIDTVMAAGMSRETIGTALLRLRSEYDAISGMPGSTSMVQRLRSATEVRGRLLELVSNRFGVTGASATDLVTRLMDLWCRPNCVPCDGRGTIGGYGAPQRICATCEGSKKRKVAWPEGMERIGDALMSQAERTVDRAQGRMRTLLKR